MSILQMQHRSITVSMLEHNLRPIVNEFEYPIFARSKEYAKSGIVLRNRTKFLSLPFYNDEEHENTEITLKENSFVDLQKAGGSIKKTFDLSQVGYMCL